MTTMTTTTEGTAGIRTHGRNAGSGQGLLLTICTMVAVGVAAMVLLGA